MTNEQWRRVEDQDQPDFFTEPLASKPLWFLVHEADARALMLGTVSEAIREQARCAIDWQFDALRRGERPIVPGAHKKAS